MDAKKIMDEISEKYRNGRQLENYVSRQIIEIEINKKNKTITHKDYICLNEEISERTQVLNDLKKYNDGLHDAREIVMKYVEYFLTLDGINGKL